MREMIKTFKALSDETRLRILNVLLERECCVCEVMQALEISQTRASRNLTALYDAGFLRLRKDGLWSLYSINADAEEQYLAQLIAAVRQGLADSQTASLDLERLKTAKRTGITCTRKQAV